MSRLLTRRWLVAHVVVIAAVITCMLAGRWQLRRLESRRAHNALLESRRQQAPVDAFALASERDLAYRRATVRGTYDASAQVLLTGRVLGGRTGSHVLTPLRVGGVAVLVDRGWVPQQIYEPANPPPAPPSGPVTVTGVLVPSEARGTFGPRVAPSGTLQSLPRLDVARVARQVPYPLTAYALRLQSQDPPPVPGHPVPAPLPVLEEGPHLSYAIQWFLFATVFVVGYAILVRRALRT